MKVKDEILQWLDRLRTLSCKKVIMKDNEVNIKKDKQEKKCVKQRTQTIERGTEKREKRNKIIEINRITEKRSRYKKMN